MREIKILTDSCSDLGKDIREQYGIEYVKMNIVVKGEEKPASLDWDLYSAKELYDIMRGGERVTTTQVPAQEFIAKFTELTDNGYDVIYIACSGVLSGSVNTGRVVAADVMKKNTDAKIYCIDPCASSLGEGLIVIRAAELVKEGKTAEEIVEIIEDCKLCANQFVTVNSLDALKRAGRVSASSAFFGNLFGVKPIIISDANGQNVALKKVKGRTASIDALAELLAEAMEGETDRRVFIAHADCDQEEVDYLVSKAKELIGTEDIYVNYIGPIIGASIGPDALAIFGWGKKVGAES